MKEASGELNMTVVTIVAVAAVGALFYLFVWPIIQSSIVSQTCKTYGSDWKAHRTGETTGGSGNAKVQKWVCCPPSASPGSEDCVDAEYGKTTENAG